jgi:Protein of unknown function (DUF2809)
MSKLQKRWVYTAFIIITIVLGVGSRHLQEYLPEILKTNAGDILAATCIFWGVRFWATQTPLYKITLYSYCISIAIETLQLYQAPWFQKIRHTPPMGILLGYGFLWSDWVCYAVGVLLAWGIAYFMEYKTMKPA